MTNRSVIFKSKALQLGTFTPTKVRQTRRNNVERDTIGALLQSRKHLRDLKVRPRPPVDEEQRNRVRRGGLLMNEMNIKFRKAISFDRRVEIG